MRAKLAMGLFFATLVFVQPLGPALKRWPFHQRNTFSAGSSAGCLLFWFMFVSQCVHYCCIFRHAFFFAEDKYRALTAATIVLANLPLVLKIVFAPAAHA